MAQIVSDLDCIWINGEKFKGIGYQGLMTVNTRTYVESPTRSNDGSIPNINDYDSFVVPRAKINFKLLTLEDYQRLCRIVASFNEFTVKYWDKQFGDFVTHKMYCEPEEMKKLFNVGTRVIGVIDYEISFIGTLNDLEQCSVVYLFNASPIDSSILSSATYDWGRTMEVITQAEVEIMATEQGLTIPTGKHLSGWNTKRDGSGFTYLIGTSPTVFENLNLFAVWE